MPVFDPLNSERIYDASVSRVAPRPTVAAPLAGIAARVDEGEWRPADTFSHPLSAGAALLNTLPPRSRKVWQDTLHDLPDANEKMAYLFVSSMFEREAKDDTTGTISGTDKKHSVDYTDSAFRARVGAALLGHHPSDLPATWSQIYDALHRRQLDANEDAKKLNAHYQSIVQRVLAGEPVDFAGADASQLGLSSPDAEAAASKELWSRLGVLQATMQHLRPIAENLLSALRDTGDLHLDGSSSAFRNLLHLNKDDRQTVFSMVQAMAQRETAGDRERAAGGDANLFSKLLNSTGGFLHQSGRALFRGTLDVGRNIAFGDVLSHEVNIENANQVRDENADLPGWMNYNATVPQYLSGENLMPGYRWMTAADKKERDEYLKRLRTWREVESDIHAISRRVVSPLLSDNFVTRKITQPFLEQLPFMATALSPATLPVTALAVKGMRAEEMLRRGVPAAQADIMSSISAVLETPVEFVEGKLFLGKFPGLRSILRAPAQNVSQFLARAAGLGAIGAATQVGQEVIQDVTPLVIQDVFSAFDKAVPEVDWKQYRDEFADNTIDTFWALLPAIIVGHGLATFREASFLQQSQFLRAAGFSADAIDAINIATERGGADAGSAEMRKQRETAGAWDFNSETAKREREKLDAKFRQFAEDTVGKGMAYVGQMPTTGEWYAYDPVTGATQLAPAGWTAAQAQANLGALVDAVNAHRAAFGTDTATSPEAVASWERARARFNALFGNPATGAAGEGQREESAAAPPGTGTAANPPVPVFGGRPPAPANPLDAPVLPLTAGELATTEAALGIRPSRIGADDAQDTSDSPLALPAPLAPPAPAAAPAALPPLTSAALDADIALESGNWAPPANLDVNATVPVISVTPVPTQKQSATNISRWLYSQLPATTVQNAMTGWNVGITRTTVQETLHYSADLTLAEKNGLVVALPDIIQHGLLLEQNVDKEGGLSRRARRSGVLPGRSHILYAPVSLENRPHVARVIVSEIHQGGHRAYVATAVEIDNKGAAGSLTVREAPSQNTSGDTLAYREVSVGDLYAAVKRYFRKTAPGISSTVRRFPKPAGAGFVSEPAGNLSESPTGSAAPPLRASA
ncbi:MAG: hypothetical protein LBR07_04475, partial [Puniceicoccales bacterium]|nr:hypothetical protein [Puniceicoccales bacterium]